MLLSQTKTKQPIKKVVEEDFNTMYNRLHPQIKEKPYTLLGMPAERLTNDQYNTVMNKFNSGYIGKSSSPDLFTNKEAIQMIYNVKPGAIIENRYYQISVGRSSFDRNAQTISVWEHK